MAYLGFGKGGHGEREPTTGAWRRSPERGPGAEPLVGESGRQSPPKAETHFAFERSMEAANSPIFVWNSETQKITASYQMQCDMAILIAYCIGMKKDHQTLLNFAILAGKRQKQRTFSLTLTLTLTQFLLENGKNNAPFHIKSP